ncbi:enoyl-CoA hydratase/isomerase family protein [bacterium M00.F.Ca.ET.228.01.1.1]|uniref:enoyl-CoA hydratase/isomerase family protein n=1 Tax=Paraburkholderia phenoliruptrix TaxID=252970 RepID=UPI0010930312|nr:enoyl-CoA hydratase/isomerase family protein [Paraburkholderia phenoliruptrix]TGP48092.1 enoyl-CoA hydratase/isomerase family protein [bacterium M00.F.Ca.ET.228.01.1.1]TGS05884.1 enoyl-CoA hydratase/isomerase family protein [bacterium M00.F.Ca.ET.191.01.1.1]TGU10821.1 enoyl-CoA hydratase/isomerase family protein [bacterium M00.F.Ca.ET.155.01.1.1]MBW0445081.1 enoyl-CoA hydratase/isomerase family protein [Paraburkholderia phenoliruptrix]MBW9095846.1 enoyl-CoA hydratase/isomerase family protei
MSALQSVVPEFAPPAGVDVEREILFRVVNRVAIITLNRPAALNALSHAMIRELAVLVEHCRDDDGIVALVLKGAGNKGFCAGGDVREVYRLAKNGDSRWLAFFVEEYRLDYALHTFPKPVVALLDGIAMGGGMGLGQAARLRIVTERSKIAMPETRIGFVPDVGATRFLAVMPVEFELYVGLSGVTLSGADALRLQLADLCVPADWLASAEERLRRMSHEADLLSALRGVFEPPCNIVPHAALAPLTQVVLRHFDRRSGVDRIVATLRHDLERDSPREVRQWLQSTYDALTAHSPTMLHVTREALLRGRQMTLAECFRMELGIVKRAIEEGDFCEGVRAQLIDKDRKGRWAPATLPEVRPERVRHFLTSPWKREAHPLADLGGAV